MLKSGTCANCGTALNRDALDGFCPACTFEGALQLQENQVNAGAPEPEPAEASEAEGIDEKPQVLGDYELLEEIGRGGMGVVYRARQVSLDRIVALKLILMGVHADKLSLRRFQAEAAAAAKLQHPNIVAIHEVGEERGQHFFSMDYVPGRNLEDYAREHPFTASRAAMLMRTIAQTLHYAHEQGIVHRDLKPSNILLDLGAEPHISDFGLAKHLQDSQTQGPASQLTLTGQVLGSPSFLPPEQASGKRGPTGRHTDVYALGAVLYYLLTGRPPFVGETITDTLQQVMSEEPVEPRLLNRGVPRDLETICLKCLEKEPGSRYGTAEELGEELNRFLSGEPIKARPVSLPARTWRWCRRKPVVAGLAAGIVFAVAAGFLGVLWQWRHSEEHRQLAEKNADDSRRRGYAADMMLALSELERDNMGHAEEILLRYVPNDGESDLRGWEWRYAWDQCRSDDLFTLKSPYPAALLSLALSPDGAYLAAGSPFGFVAIWDLREKRLQRILQFETGVSAVAFGGHPTELIMGTKGGELSRWSMEKGHRLADLPRYQRPRTLAVSPDGRILAIYALRVLALVDLADNREVEQLPLLGNDEFYSGGLAFSPDSVTLAYCRGDGAIVLRDITQRKDLGVMEAHRAYVTSLVFSRDGSLLISGSRDRTVRVWHVATRAELREAHDFAGPVTGLALSPDGGTLAVAGSGQRVKLFDTGSWEEIGSRKGHTEEIRSITFAPDGESLLTCGTDGTVKGWGVKTIPETASITFPRAGTIVGSPDCRFLHAQDSNSFNVWQTCPPKFLHGGRLPTPSDQISRALAPDGSCWAAAFKDGTVRMYDGRDGHVLAEVKVTFGAIERLEFSPDGRRLAVGGGQVSPRCLVWQWDPGTPSAGDGNLKEIGELRFQKGQPLKSLRFSPNGDLVCAGFSAGRIEVWQVSTANRLRILEGDAYDITDIALTQDHSRLAAASGSGRVWVWDLEVSGEWTVFGGQLVSTFSVAFSPDGTRLAACGGDGTVRLWDMKTAQPVALLKLHWERLGRVAFADEDTLIVLAYDRFNEDRLFILRAPRSDVEPEPKSAVSARWEDFLRDIPTRWDPEENLRLRGLLPRAAETPPELLDLSAFFNFSLAGIQDWQFAPGSGDDPQAGRRRFGSREFDVRGAIRLACANPVYAGGIFPPRVPEVSVELKCRRLHFLHCTFAPETDGTTVAKYLVHFSDGKHVEVPVRYGEHFRTWGPYDRQVLLSDPKSSLVWSGTNTLSWPGRLFQSTWENPRPHVEIRTIDFVSLMTQSSPILIAITVEP